VHRFCVVSPSSFTVVVVHRRRSPSSIFLFYRPFAVFFAHGGRLPSPSDDAPWAKDGERSGAMGEKSATANARRRRTRDDRDDGERATTVNARRR